MKYLCLVYRRRGSPIQTMDDRHCLDYDEAVRASGRCIASEALQPVATATTVRVLQRQGLGDRRDPSPKPRSALPVFYLVEARDLKARRSRLSPPASRPQP